jgi:3,5-epimerase/4-reductase
MTKILIYGSEGWIGKQVCLYLKSQSIEYIKGNVRAEDIDELEKEIQEIKPTHVMSFIGRTHGKIGEKEYTTIDYLEQPGKIKENVRDNLYSPIVLAILSNKYDFHYTYLGTGCIFEFDESHPFGEEINGFKEDAVPNFFGSAYSVVKGYTDRLMHLFPKVLNVRIRMPITADKNPRNFITKITTYKKICSVPNSMTVLPELLPMMIDMALNKNITGTINLTNPGLISHNEILQMYKEIVDPEFVWENFSVQEQNEILAAGRSNNYLDTTRLEELYPDVLNIKDSVRKCLEQIKSNPESFFFYPLILDNSNKMENENKAKIVYITAIYGNYELSCKKFAEQTVKSDFICFTDNKEIISNGWIIDTNPYHLTNKSILDDDKKLNSICNNKHTFNIAKYYKQNFYNIPKLKEYDCVVWLDGTLEITSENVSKYLLNNINEHNIIGWSHEYRSGKLILETIASDFERYTSTNWFGQEQPFQNIYKQYVNYINNGYKEEFWDEYKSNTNNINFGMWITCFVAFNNKNEKIKEFLDLWYDQTLIYSTQDQIGFPYICQKLNMIPLTLPNNDIKGDRPHENTDFYLKHNHHI